MYNKGIIRILLFAIYIYGACFKGYSLLFSPAEQKDLGRFHAMQCMRRLLMYALMFCSPDGQDQKVDSSMKSTDAFKLVSTKISLALWNWSVWLVGRGAEQRGGGQARQFIRAKLFKCSVSRANLDEKYRCATILRAKREIHQEMSLCIRLSNERKSEFIACLWTN